MEEEKKNMALWGPIEFTEFGEQSENIFGVREIHTKKRTKK